MVHGAYHVAYKHGYVSRMRKVAHCLSIMPTPWVWFQRWEIHVILHWPSWLCIMPDLALPHICLMKGLKQMG